VRDMLFGLRAGGCCLDRCSCVHVFSAINISGLLHRGKSAIKSATEVWMESGVYSNKGKVVKVTPSDVIVAN